MRLVERLAKRDGARGHATASSLAPRVRRRRWTPEISLAVVLASSPAMPARDSVHQHVRRALERDGWTITHDPLRLSLGRRTLYVDLGAERLLAAEKGARKIAVEIKSFSGPSDVKDLEDAVGQFVVYDHALRREQPGRTLYLAVPEAAWQLIFTDEIGQILLDDHVLQVVTFDPAKEEIIRWTP
jgi:hypothetical protein